MLTNLATRLQTLDAVRQKPDARLYTLDAVRQKPEANKIEKDEEQPSSFSYL